LKVLQPAGFDLNNETIDLQVKNPVIMLDTGHDTDSYFVPPFYVSMDIHEKTLHNCLLDSGASHNLMPKIMMDELGLDINKPHHDLYTFDSKRVKCLGVIKVLVVTLT